MLHTSFALAYGDLGVSPSLVAFILALTSIILIGFPLYLVTNSKGGNNNSLADY